MSDILLYAKNSKENKPQGKKDDNQLRPQWGRLTPCRTVEML